MRMFWKRRTLPRTTDRPEAVKGIFRLRESLNLTCKRRFYADVWGRHPSMPLTCYFTFGFCAFCECMSSCSDSQWGRLRSRRTLSFCTSFSISYQLTPFIVLPLTGLNYLKWKHFKLAISQHSKTVWRCCAPTKLWDTDGHYSQFSKTSNIRQIISKPNIILHFKLLNFKCNKRHHSF